MAELHIDNKGWKYQWSAWEDEIIKEYYPKNGYEKVLKLLPNRNKSGIQGRASKLGIKYLSYNQNYFETINSESKAYWLGFLYADGYTTSNNRWGLELAIKDYKHMINLLNEINCNINIKTRKRNGNESCFFQINNKKMYTDLNNNGVVKNKTEILTFPNEKILPINYFSHFIRGFFDGDGCVTYSNDSYIRKDRNNKIYNNLRKEISIVCKSQIFIEKMQQVLKDLYDINFEIDKNKKNLYILRTYSKLEIEKFINVIYNNSNDTNRLSRKYIKFQELLCHLQ